MADKKAQIKELSLLGSFKEIQEKHGETAFRRGKEYAESKLKTLRGLREVGDAIPEGTSEFLTFALDQNVDDDIEVIANKFHGEGTKAEKEGSDDGWDSDATGPQVQEKPVAVPEEHDDPEEDNVKDNDDLAAEKETQAQEEIHTQAQAQEQTEDEALEEAPPVKLVPEPIKAKKGGFQLPSVSSKFKPQQPKAPTEVTPGTKSDADDDDDDSGSPTTKLKASRSSSSSIKKIKAAKSDKIKIKGTKTTSKKEKKEKKEKIEKPSFENLPKGAKSSYIIFSESERHVIKAENCALPAKLMLKEIGVRWNLLTDGEKAVWSERAAEDKIRFARDYQEFTEEFPDKARRYEAWKAENSKRGTKKGSDKSESKKRKRSKSPAADGKKVARKSRGKGSRKNLNDEDEDDADDEEEEDDEMDIAVVHDDNDDAGKDEAEFDEKPSRSAPPRRIKTTTNKTPASTPRSRSLTHSSSVSKKPQKRETTTGSTQPPIVIVDPAIDNQRTSKLIAGLKGIKQSDLPQHEDIMQTKIVPVDRAPFPADYKPAVGGHAVLILEPYREFMSELPLDFISQEELQLVQAICSLSTATAVGKIIGVQSATSRGGSGPNQASSNEEDVKGSQEGNRPPDDALFVKMNIGGDHFTVLYLPFASPLMRTDVFLIDKTAYDKILKAPWLVPNAQVRRPFAADEDDGLGAEWLEGSIYHVRPDFKKNPYRSISVVWMKLEESPRRWFYAYTQTDNICSPWDLQLSKYVLPENIPSIVPLPSSLQGHTVDAMAVLAYLKSFDFASVFKYKISTNGEYCEMFPDRHDQLDFHVLDVRCSSGRYKGSNISTLFSDLELMIANGKQFNEQNKDFQPWRLCDIMEKKVADLKERLGTRVVPSSSSSSSSCSSSSSSLLHPNNKNNRSTGSGSGDNQLTSTFDGEAEETADLDALEQEEV